MKRIPLLFLPLLFLPACQQVNGEVQEDENEEGSKEKVQKAIRTLAQDPALEKGRFVFLARNIKNGDRIAAHRSKEGIVPASTQKLVTTIGALRILGKEKRFRTVFGYRGNIEEGRLKGDLIIRGGGDPAFLSKEFPGHYGASKELFDRWVQACKQAGIEQVEGRILVNATYFPSNTLSRGRIWEDMGNYFGAFPSGMNIMDNTFELRFKTPRATGEKTRIIERNPKTPWLKIENQVRTSDVQKDRAYIFGKPYDTHRIVEGTLPSGRSSYSIEGAMPDPALTTAWMVQQHFEEQGISIRKGFNTFRREGIEEHRMSVELDTIHSPSVEAIVERTNQESKNLFAETLLLEMAKKLGATAKPEPAGKALLKRIGKWGVDTKGLRLADGSGLAPTNRINPAFLVECLSKAWKGSHREAIKNSLPVAGKEGTMSYIGGGTAAEGRVWAKSGYMKGILGYAGYVKGKGGAWKAFALIANDFEGSAAEMRKKMEPVLVSMVR